MVNMSDYPAFFSKTIELLRYEGIKKGTPGYELLIRAIVICKVEGSKNLYEKVSKQRVLIPFTEVDLTKKQDRTPAEQWMIEALKGEGYEMDVITFVQNLAKKI